MPRVVEARAVTKSFGRTRVLRDVDLSIEKGERYVLFGSNGAGKTTLVKVLSSILPPDSGEVLLFGEAVEGRPRELLHRIGLLSHEPYLYLDLTAWENLVFFGSLYDVPNREGRAREMLKSVGLFHRAHDRVSTFSRGMRQRLGLARAVLHDPELIFLDEPYAGLDMVAQRRLSDLVEGLSGEGRTFLSITHDVDRGFDIATRVGVLSGGRIVLETDDVDRAAFRERYDGIIRGEGR